MIDIGKILKRAWHILWNYRVLWIFGILLAMTAGGSGGGGNSGSGYHTNGSGNNNINFNPGPFWTGVQNWFQENVVPLFTHPGEHLATFIWIGVGLLLLFLVIGILGSILHYVSDTPVIRLVDGYEQNGVKLSFRQGWRLGWTRSAFRLWLIDLVISLPVIVFLLLTGLLGLGLYFTVRNGSAPALVGSVVAIGLLTLFILLTGLVMICLGLLRPFFARAAVLEQVGVGQAFRRGWQTVRTHWKSAGLVWLVMIGLWIGFWIVTVILIIMLIPAFIITGITGLVVAAVPTLAAFGITSIFTGGPLTWIIAILIGLPFFLLVLLSPLLLVSSWVQVYTSSVWTLAYREMKTLETIAQPVVPAANV